MTSLDRSEHAYVCTSYGIAETDCPRFADHRDALKWTNQVKQSTIGLVAILWGDPNQWRFDLCGSLHCGGGLDTGKGACERAAPVGQGRSRRHFYLTTASIATLDPPTFKLI